MRCSVPYERRASSIARAVALVLLDDQPLGTGVDRGRYEAREVDPSVAHRAERALSPPAQVLDVHERPPTEQRDGVDARVPRPAGVELEEHAEREPVEKALLDLGVVVVVPELEARGGDCRCREGEAIDRLVVQVGRIDPAHDEPLPAERARLRGELRQPALDGLESAVARDRDQVELVQPVRDRLGRVSVEVDDLDTLVAERCNLAERPLEVGRAGVAHGVEHQSHAITAHVDLLTK